MVLSGPGSRGTGITAVKRSKTGRSKTVRRRPAKAAPRKRKSAAKPAVSGGAAAALRQRLEQKARELDEALEQQAATADVLKAISGSTFDLQDVLETLVRSAAKLCRADRAAVRLLKDGAFHHLASCGFTALQRDFMAKTPVPAKPHRGSIAGRVLIEGQIVQIADSKADPDFRLTVRPAFADVRTVLGVPLLRGDTLIGLLIFSRKLVEQFTDRQISLVQNFSAQAVIAIENARLLSELRQRTSDLTEALERQTATGEVLKVISTSPTDANPVFETILESACQLCNSEIAAIFRFDGALLHLAATKNWPAEAMASLAIRWPMAPNPHMTSGQVVLSRGVVIQEDTLADPNYDPDAAEAGGWRRMLGVPMLRSGEIIGVVVVTWREPGPIAPKQVELLQTFAAQAVIAVENARLFNELRQSLEQQTATADVLRVISSSPGELEPVFQAMLDNATRLCEAPFGILLLRGEDLLRIVSRHVPPEVSTKVFEPGSELVFADNPTHPLVRMVETREIVHIADLRNDRAYIAGNRRVVAFADDLGGRAALCVPMLKDNECVGGFVIFRRVLRPFTEKQIDLVRNFAAQAVIAIENARLLSELHESLEQQTATAEVLKVISASPGELQPVFQATIDNATRLCGAKFGGLSFREGDVFRSRAIHGVQSVYLEERLRDPIIRPTPGHNLERLLRTKTTVHIPDLASDVEAAQMLFERAGARALLNVPLLKKGDVVGSIMIYRDAPGGFTDKQIELVQNFAAQAVIAIENARLLNELRETLEQQTATADVLRVISASPGDLEPVFRVMLENATQICQATFGVLSLREGAGLRVVAMHQAPQAYAELRRREPVWTLTGPMGRIVAQAVATRQGVQVPDLAAYGDDDPLIRDFSTTTGARSLILVPLLKDGELIGTSAIYRQEVRPFTDKQVELLTNFAAQAVIAIENTRLLNELRQRTTDLSKSLEDLRTAQDRLVQTEKLASLGQLTAGIAHEIKNPLNFVNNFSSLSVELIEELQEELASASISEAKRAEITELADTLKGNLDKIAQHGKRADAIVKNMLLHSREGSGEHRPVDVNALVEESLTLAYHGARAEKQGFNITLERSFDASAGEADLYPQEMTRVLLNIIANGFYAAHKRKGQADSDTFEPTVIASTRNLGDRVEIRIRDNGTGIPPEVKEKMFNPFFTTKPAGEGTGLGLSISHDIIVKQHSGTIDIDTRPGEFTEFRIVLPRAAAFPDSQGGNA